MRCRIFLETGEALEETVLDLGIHEWILVEKDHYNCEFKYVNFLKVGDKIVSSVFRRKDKVIPYGMLYGLYNNWSKVTKLEFYEIPNHT